MTFFLIGGRSQCGVSGILMISLLVPTSLGSIDLWSACSHHPPSGWGGLGSQRTTQKSVSDY